MKEKDTLWSVKERMSTTNSRSDDGAFSGPQYGLDPFQGPRWKKSRGLAQVRSHLPTMPTALFPTLSTESRTAQLRKRPPTFSPNGFLAAFLKSWIEMSTELKWLKSAKLSTSQKGSFASFWNLIPLLQSVEQGNLGVFPAAGRQPLVVHGNAASGKVLGVECVGWCY